MNSETLVQLLQKSFHVTLGATASFAEVLQDEQKRQESWRKLTENLAELTQEWSEKGKITEEEARNFVDNLMKEKTNPPDSDADSESADFSQEPETFTDSDPQAEIEELTEQLATLRSELEKLRQEEN
jgi:polyhydroxyalkanoate synthesis regulator phasin